MNEINIYAKGLLCISVCAPIDMPSDEVETLVNVEYPCGTENGWSLSKDEYFSDGKTLNGAEVDCSNGKTRHWLFDA